MNSMISLVLFAAFLSLADSNGWMQWRAPARRVRIVQMGALETNSVLTSGQQATMDCCPKGFRPMVDTTGGPVSCMNDGDCGLHFECTDLAAGAAMTGKFCCPKRAYICGIAPNYGKGVCYAKPESRYYFSQLTKKCEKMTFSGCGTDAGNNFHTQDECNLFCGSAGCSGGEWAIAGQFATSGAQTCMGDGDTSCPQNGTCKYNSLTAQSVCCAWKRDQPMSTQFPLRPTIPAWTTTPQQRPSPSSPASFPWWTTTPQPPNPGYSSTKPYNPTTTTAIRTNPTIIPATTDGGVQPPSPPPYWPITSTTIKEQPVTTRVTPTVTPSRPTVAPSRPTIIVASTVVVPSTTRTGGSGEGPISLRVCKQGKPLLNRRGQAVSCINDASCPKSHFCETGVCCPTRYTMCLDPMPAAPSVACLNAKTVFWFSPEAGECIRVSTCINTETSLNTFVDRETCRGTCEGVTPKPPGQGGATTAAPDGTAKPGQLRCPQGASSFTLDNFVPCANNNSCPTAYYCSFEGGVGGCCPSQEYICSQPFDVGIQCGSSFAADVASQPAYIRWYFDKTTSACRSFEYRGCAGNENRFQNLNECQDYCASLMGSGRRRSYAVPYGPYFPPAETPGGKQPNAVFALAPTRAVYPEEEVRKVKAKPLCPVGAALRDVYTDEIVPCRDTSHCPAAHKCVKDVTSVSNLGVCCIESGGRNVKPTMDSPTQCSIGQPRRSLRTNEPISCVTDEECGSVYQCMGSVCCPRKREVTCLHGSPLRSPDDAFHYCDTAQSDSCPAGYECYFDGYVAGCCATRASICSMPSELGRPCSPSEGSEIRYHYESSLQRCRSFTYSGCGGNGNNFLNPAECEQFCGHKKGCLYGGSPKLDQIGNAIKCADNSVCPRGYDCTPVMDVIGWQRYCCPSREHLCNQPMKEGASCEVTATSRYYFDAKSGSCSEFTYNGCESNGNNFVTNQQCINFCSASGCAIGQMVHINATNHQPAVCQSNSDCPTGFQCVYSTMVNAYRCCGTQEDLCPDGELALIDGRHQRPQECSPANLQVCPAESLCRFSQVANRYICCQARVGAFADFGVGLLQ